MAEHRPFPPSARRRALARAAGAHAASPIVVGALACAALVSVLGVLGRDTSARLGAWIAAACGAADGRTLTASGPAASTLVPTGLPRAVLELALPVLLAAALTAVLAHLAQTRAVWLPRRRVPGAPIPAPSRAQRAGVELAAGGAITVVTIGWLWTMAPRLAVLTGRSMPGAAAALIASFVTALAIGWLVLGVLDAVLRHAQLTAALRMTPAERREDERLAGADPRWRARRGELARAEQVADPRGAVAGASVLLLGDDVAVAIAWDPIHRPVPVRTATGRGPRATQLLGLARHHTVPVHRDPALAAALVDGAGPVPEPRWSRLAEIIAATRGRDRRR